MPIFCNFIVIWRTLCPLHKADCKAWPQRVMQTKSGSVSELITKITFYCVSGVEFVLLRNFLNLGKICNARQWFGSTEYVNGKNKNVIKVRKGYLQVLRYLSLQTYKLAHASLTLIINLACALWTFRQHLEIISHTAWPSYVYFLYNFSEDLKLYACDNIFDENQARSLLWMWWWWL